MMQGTYKVCAEDRDTPAGVGDRGAVSGKHQCPSQYTLGSCEDNLEGRVMSYLSSGKKNPPPSPLAERLEWGGAAQERGDQSEG